MRRFGRLLAGLGLAIGLITGLSIFLPMHWAGLSFIAMVGLVKLAFASSLALMAAGAVMERAALRRAERQRELPR